MSLHIRKKRLRNRQANRQKLVTKRLKQVRIEMATKGKNKGSKDLVWNVKEFESTLGNEAKDAIKIFFAEEKV